ncbi:hypothetical protein DUNSADRAFT_9526 [Dunaliella salina]|uniref:Uncharacterized protein n=1 Tax=Dunaliella salina TaxID=3046 RepID=A0ABQ7GH74_DUNSA|nr:hypothetical protein DUNSADRAFT_9526 [Dunaliella salina]|eukprot:KAF5833962.1 hypothetical protein DUNSADRAFT_9526 [Dunaliella salina]
MGASTRRSLSCCDWDLKQLYIDAHKAQADILLQLMRYAEAEASLRTLLAFQEKDSGRSSPETLSTRHLLQKCKSERGSESV